MIVHRLCFGVFLLGITGCVSPASFYYNPDVFIAKGYKLKTGDRILLSPVIVRGTSDLVLDLNSTTALAINLSHIGYQVTEFSDAHVASLMKVNDGLDSSLSAMIQQEARRLNIQQVAYANMNYQSSTHSLAVVSSGEGKPAKTVSGGFPTSLSIRIVDVSSGEHLVRAITERGSASEMPAMIVRLLREQLVLDGQLEQ